MKKIICIFYLFSIGQLAAYSKGSNVDLDTVKRWFDVPYSPAHFVPFEYSKPWDSQTFLYPTNLRYNKKQLCFYNTPIKGITAYFNDSANVMFNVILFVDSVYSQLIIDSLQVHLGAPENSGYRINGQDVRSNIVAWRDSAFAVVFSRAHAYSNMWKGCHFAYFDKCDFITITSAKMPADFMTQFGYNILKAALPPMSDEEYQKVVKRSLTKKCK